MELQDKLRCFRIENGISQLEAAEKLEVSRQTVYRWETGTSLPSMDNLMRLSKLYNVPLNVWTDDDWTPNPLHQPPELETSILEPAIPEPEPAIPELTAQEVSASASVRCNYFDGGADGGYRNRDLVFPSERCRSCPAKRYELRGDRLNNIGRAN